MENKVKEMLENIEKARKDFEKQKDEIRKNIEIMLDEAHIIIACTDRGVLTVGPKGSILTCLSLLIKQLREQGMTDIELKSAIQTAVIDKKDIINDNLENMNSEEIKSLYDFMKHNREE